MLHKYCKWTKRHYYVDANNKRHYGTLKELNKMAAYENKDITERSNKPIDK